MWTKHGLARRRNCGSRKNRCSGKLLRVNGYRIARNGLCARKSALRHRGHCASDVPIHVSNIVDRRVVFDDRRVVDIRDLVTFTVVLVTFTRFTYAGLTR